jgi:hypothetical protein
MAKITGAFSAVVAKPLKIITIRNLTVIRQRFKGVVSERKLTVNITVLTSSFSRL